MKCARTVCPNRGQWPHVDLPGYYCDSCASAINAAAPAGRILVPRNVGETDQAIKWACAQPHPFNPHAGPIQIREERAYRLQELMTFAKRLYENYSTDPVDVECDVYRWYEGED